MSLSKFADSCRKDVATGDNLFWNRADMDGGLPFRGQMNLYRSEDEYEERVKPTADFKAAIFDVADPDSFRRYQEIMDRALNHWYRILYVERLFDKDKTKIYLEWAENFMQDNRPVQVQASIGR